MLLALVLVGNPYMSAPNNQLVRPPEIPGTNQKYDSVTTQAQGVQKLCPKLSGMLNPGMRGNGAFYMVYSNNKAYPYYVIEYQ